MARAVAVGAQYFDEIRDENCFYIDKTNFIKEWWENKAKVTLITRPRRFGKTLTMSTIDYFFLSSIKIRLLYSTVFPFGRMRNIEIYKALIP